MRIRIFTIALILSPLIGFGQGMVFDRESYNRMPMFNLADNASIGSKGLGSKAALKKDLRLFMPSIVSQAKMNNCVPISTLYYAAGLRLAYIQNDTDKEKISNDYSLSALFNPKRNGMVCKDPMALDAMLNDLVSKGGVPNKFYPYNECEKPLPKIQPTVRAVNPQRMCGVDSEGNIPCNSDQMLYNIRLAITNGFPVVAGIPIGRLGEYNVAKNRFYQPKNNIVTDGHAVTIVGYESEYFIVANSWGPKWGDQGYFYILQDDLKKILLGAFTFGLNISEMAVNVNAVSKGLGIHSNLTDEKNGPQSVQYQGNGVYRAEKNYRISDKFFSVIKNLNSEMYITILSQDSDDLKIEKHYPRKTKNFGLDEVFLSKDSPIIFPHPDYPLEITTGRQDHIIILASKNDISAELPYIIKNLETSSFKKSPIDQRLNTALNGRMIASKDILYDNREIKGELKNLDASGDILPLIIEINHR